MAHAPVLLVSFVVSLFPLHIPRSGSLPEPFLNFGQVMTGQQTTFGKGADIASLPLDLIVNLKRKPGQPKDYNKDSTRAKVVDEVEVECTQTMFMSPFHDPVEFALNSSIYSRIDKTCKWKFVGSEPCIPMITCDTSHLTRKCEEEYIEIVDGGAGYMKFCGGETQISNVSATDGLRDLYVHFFVFKTPSIQEKRSTIIFNCTVICSQRWDGTSLDTRFSPKINPKCFCGTKLNGDRIVGGEAARKFEFPWLVALVETNTRQPFCGGSIINNRFILTAAHCIQGKFMDFRNIQVVVNGHEFDQSPNQFSAQEGETLHPKTYPVATLEKIDRMNRSKRYNLEEILIHPLYIVDTNDFDLALLKLQDDIDLNPRSRSVDKDSEVSPIPRAVCLPELARVTYDRTYSNKYATVAGWGLPAADAIGTAQILQKVEVKIFSPAVCKELFAHRVNRRMLCAGHREGGKDSCSGDSGAPLIIQEKPNIWTQVGTVSWGEGCGERDRPGVYFRVTEGLQWIYYNSNYNAERDGNIEDRSATWCPTPP